MQQVQEAELLPVPREDRGLLALLQSQAPAWNEQVPMQEDLQAFYEHQ